MSRALVCVVILGAVWATAPASVAQQASRQAARKEATSPKTQKLSNPLNDLLDEAQRDMDRNDFQAALAPLEKFLAEKPDVAYAHFQLGYAYTALQRRENARAEYQRAVELDPKLSAAHLNLGILLLERDPAAAVAPLRKAVELMPGQSRPRYLLGRALERSGDLPGALDSFEGAERLDPHDVDTVLAHAVALLRANRPGDAEAKFRAALGLQANSAPARLGLARSLEAQQGSDAEEAYRSYLELQPEDREARRQLARIAFRKKQYDAAVAELDRADAGEPRSLNSLRLRADIQIAQSRWDDAIATLRNALALVPDDVELRAGLGRLYLEKREFAAAERELKAALRVDSNYLPAWKDLSSTYYLSGDCAETLATLDRIARGEPPGAGTWFIRATCYDKLGRAQDALDAYQKFLGLDHNEHENQIWQAQQRILVLRKTLEKKR